MTATTTMLKSLFAALLFFCAAGMLNLALCSAQAAESGTGTAVQNTQPVPVSGSSGDADWEQLFGQVEMPQTGGGKSWDELFGEDLSTPSFGGSNGSGSTFNYLAAEGTVKTAYRLFTDEISKVTDGIHTAATRLFAMLCWIAIVLNGIKLIFKDGDLQAFVAVLVRFMLIIGVFYYLLQNGTAIAAQIINSLTELTGSQRVGPSELVERIFDVTERVLRSHRSTENMLSLNTLTLALTIIIFDFILFGVVASTLVLYFSAYVLCTAGVFVLGFGALSFTRQFAVNYLQLTIATALELMTMLLICNIGFNAMEQLEHYIVAQGMTSFSSQGVMLMMAVVLWAGSRTIPYRIGSLVTGFGGMTSSNVVNGFAAEIRMPLAPVRAVGSMIKNSVSRRRR